MLAKLRRLMIVPLAAAGLAAAVPAVAHADYWMKKSTAEGFARDAASKVYSDVEYGNTRAACRVQGGAQYSGYYVYHRFKCVWVDSASRTWGEFLIVGSHGAGNYYYKTLHGRRDV